MTFLFIVGLILSLVLPIASANIDNMPVFWSVIMVIIGVLLILMSLGSAISVKDAIKEIYKIRNIDRGRQVVSKFLKDILSELIISNGTIDFGDSLVYCKRHKKIATYPEYVEEGLENDVNEKLGELVTSGKVKKQFIGNGQYIYINNSGTGTTMKTQTIEITVD